MKKYVLILSTFISLNTYAASNGWKDCDESGTAACEYQIKDGVLTIRGTGENGAGTIPDYDDKRDCTLTRYFECTTLAPWRWDEDAETVHTVNIEKGITSIGADAFEDMQMTSVNLPDGLTSIKSLAFHQCGQLSNINLPDSIETIEDWALSPSSINTLKLPSNLETIGYRAFDSVQLKDSFLVIPDSVTSLSENAIYSYNPQSRLTKLYCSASLMEACEKAAANAGLEVFEYTKDEKGRYAVENNLYLSLSDMQEGKIFIPKRIYTIDEANQVAGPKNRVSIKYR
ncbi:MAG: leucine-rich repeat domain-containing protein [Alphaproteobacteria bacterium]|nr:leucine-rich repeat domain-containing protein [Alphaproteobacteria bacterium]